MGFILALGFIASNAWATVSLSPSSTANLICTGSQTSVPLIEAYINTNCGGLMGSLYKANAGSPVTEAGPFAGSYSTTFFNTTADPSNATIVYDGGAFIQPGGPVQILVKDGNQSIAWYLFQVEWDGQENIELSDFWPRQGAISFAAIYGNSVPDGGVTLMLLGGALVGLQTARRKLRA